MPALSSFASGSSRIQRARSSGGGRQFGRVVMRQFISLLLLLGVLMAALVGPSVATARTRELLVAAIGDQGGLDQSRRTINTLTDAPEVAVKDAEQTMTGRGRSRMYERLNYRRFGTRKNPSQDHFSGRIPFTSDYGRIKRHPPKHN